MSKELKSKKETKKQPAMSLKEKRTAKKTKQGSGSLLNSDKSK